METRIQAQNLSGDTRTSRQEGATTTTEGATLQGGAKPARQHRNEPPGGSDHDDRGSDAPGGPDPMGATRRCRNLVKKDPRKKSIFCFFNQTRNQSFVSLTKLIMFRSTNTSFSRAIFPGQQPQPQPPCVLHVCYMCATCVLHVCYMCDTCMLHVCYMCAQPQCGLHCIGMYIDNIY